jgi:4-hydroxy-tetrahydrodipicolinate synthase
MRNKNIIGTGVALITPFNEDLTIDYNSLGCLIEDLILNHIDYFVILGTTAETSNLSLEEQDEVIAYIQEIVNGRIPLVLGVGGNSTRDVVSRIDSLDFSSFEAILSVVPYYNKPTQNGLIAHYSAISEACPVDVILYNVPSRSSLNMEVDTIVMLAKKYKDLWCN